MIKSLASIIPALLIALLPATVFSQGTQTGEPDILKRLEMIEKGQADAVRAELPTLMTNFQNNPGVLYLQGVLTTDGSEAAKIYQSIVDNFPKSEWADDASFKLYQDHYSIGLYKTADQKLEQLKRDYPFSTYATDQKVAEEAKVVPPVETPAKVTQPSKGEKSAIVYTVQAGTFSVLQNAEELKSRLRTGRVRFPHFHHCDQRKEISQSLGRGVQQARGSKTFQRRNQEEVSSRNDCRSPLIRGLECWLVRKTMYGS